MTQQEFYYPKAARVNSKLHSHGDIYTVIVEKRDYVACKRASEDYWKIPGNDPKDLHKEVRQALIAEMAVAKLFRFPLPTSYLKCGTDPDITFGDYTVEVIETCLDSGSFYIQHQDADLSVLPLDRDFYIFAKIEADAVRARKASVSVIGWIKPSMLTGRAQVAPLSRTDPNTYWIIPSEIMGDITKLRTRKLTAFGDGLKGSESKRREFDRNVQSFAHTFHGSVVEDEES